MLVSRKFSAGSYLFTVSNRGLLFSSSAVTNFPTLLSLFNESTASITENKPYICWPITMNFETDLDSVKENQHVTYQGKSHLFQKLLRDTNTDTPTDCIYCSTWTTKTVGNYQWTGTGNRLWSHRSASASCIEQCAGTWPRPSSGRWPGHVPWNQLP